MSIKHTISIIIKSLPAGQAVYLFVLKCYKKVVLPIRRRRLQKYGFPILRELNKVLTENGVEYYIAFGTLLGIIRENNFLRHDDDIDILVKKNDVNEIPKVILFMANAGFDFKHYLVSKEGILYYTFEKYGVSIDLFTYITDLDNGRIAVDCVYLDKNIKYPKPSYCSVRRNFYPLIEGRRIYSLNGADFVIPENYDELLISMYGKNWRTPIAVWTDDDAPNSFENLDLLANCCSEYSECKMNS